MESLSALMHGFAVSVTPYNLWMAAVGCFIGTIVGILPGLGPSATIAILLPFTFGMNPIPALIMLTCIVYGSKYGGSTTSILLNVPGESASVVTALDGYQMARQGRAGSALGISAIGSFVGGSLGGIALIFICVPLAEFSLKFGPAEYVSLILMAMLTVVFIGGKSIAKSLMSGLIGYALSMVGTDPVQGAPRFVYGQPYLMDGVSFVVVVMGLFGITECLVSVEERMKMETLKVPFRDCFPTFRDIIDSTGAILRGTFIGFWCGVLPGAGSTLSSFLSYGVEKSMSKHPERFGKGAIEGVAGPETANNAACSGEMVPLLSIGIPSSGSNAMLLGGMILCGLRPGPLLFQTNPEFVWTIIANLFIANFILLIMNLPMVPLFAMTLRIPYSLLYPAIFIVCVIGAYSMNSDPTDIGLMFLFGGIGYFLRKLDIPGAPMIIALVLGKMFENAIYQALNLSHGSLMTIVTRPISATLLAMATALTVLFMFKNIRQKRKLLEEEQV